MNPILRIVLAVLVALIVAGVLDYLGVLSHGLNVLIGIALGIAFYFGYPERRVL